MATLVELAPGHFRLDGDLDLAAVGALARETARLLPPGARPRGRGRRAQMVAAAPRVVQLDLAGVGQASSAAVALLLEWTDQIEQAGCRLVCSHWPDDLVRIADFSNVDWLLGIHAAAG